MSKDHPVIGYDEGLIESISAGLDLRQPNKEALDTVAVALSDTYGKPWFGVCDLATAVGKTYLAAGLIDYLAQSDASVRNFLIIVPNTTVFNKTIENFTPGSRRSLVGRMTTRPVVIHPGNFNAGWVAAEMANPASTKLFIFNIQQLIAPTMNVSRKTRDDDNENLGVSLYTMLKELDDLVVLSDEHHLYASKAAVFAAAIDDLGAMAVVGLTATPDKTQIKDVVYHYPLARAIFERIVKTPCITGRSDNRSDRETQYRDAIVLLSAKKDAADQYAVAEKTFTINPVLLVVATSIEEADEAAVRLRQSDMFGSDEAVLVVHSNSEDVDLERLAEVESIDSTVRAIVSVQMLGVGWDVKNVYVILSLRPSVSEALTEQTLGRGLRLPWGVYTDNEMLDTVEVLAHEQYKKLLADTDKILDGLVRAESGDHSRADAARRRAAAKHEVSTHLQNLALAIPTPGETKVARPDGQTGNEPLVAFFMLEDVEDRKKSFQESVKIVNANKVVLPRGDVTLEVPIVSTHVVPQLLNLSRVKSEDFEQIGARIGNGEVASLLREVLNIKVAVDGLHLASTPAKESVSATQMCLPAGSVRDQIVHAITGCDFIPSTPENLGGARRLADAVIDGADGEDNLVSELANTIDIVLGHIQNAYGDIEPKSTHTVTNAVFAPVRANYRPVSPNRHGPFSTKTAYSGWAKGLHAIAWFDSEPERAAANIQESDFEVEVWVRLESGDTPVTWRSGVYQPDFAVRTKNGKLWLLEVKADKDLDTQSVRQKKEAAEEWTRIVADSGFGNWTYRLIPQSQVEASNTFAQLTRR